MAEIFVLPNLAEKRRKPPLTNRSWPTSHAIHMANAPHRNARQILRGHFQRTGAFAINFSEGWVRTGPSNVFPPSPAADAPSR